jgi:hypothetical protein
MYDKEASFYSNPSIASLNYLLSLYKEGMDFYSKVNEKYVKFLTTRMNSMLTLENEMEAKIKLLYLIKKIRNKLNQLEQPKEKELLEKELKEKSNKIIKKFEKDINSNVILIKINLRYQRNEFIKKVRKKLFNKFINKKQIAESVIGSINKNIIITPIKDFNNDSLIHQKYVRTYSDNNLNQSFFPTKIFFDEDTNYLFKNNISMLKKEEKFVIEDMTKGFIGRYSLSYSSIIQEYIKKIIESLEENYRAKIAKYKSHCDAVSFYEMIMNDEAYKSDLIRNEIGLHEENINYLKEKEELNMDLNDKLVDIVEKFEINNPIDKNAVNEIVNDYVYEILGLFV